MKRFILSTAALLLASIPVCRAGITSVVTVAPVRESSPFDADRSELSLTSGMFFSPTIVHGHRPKFNWVETNFSWGLMLTSPSSPGFFRGNWEFVVSAFGGAITEGPGNYLTGARALFRYNFVQPNARLVPFVQMGGGGVWNDAYHDQMQHMIGNDFEFSLVADLGFRYFVCKNWAVLAQGDFEHISNAGIADRNQGANAFGFQIGATWFY